MMWNKAVAPSIPLHDHHIPNLIYLGVSPWIYWLRWEGPVQSSIHASCIPFINGYISGGVPGCFLEIATCQRVFSPITISSADEKSSVSARFWTGVLPPKALVPEPVDDECFASTNVVVLGLAVIFWVSHVALLGTEFPCNFFVEVYSHIFSKAPPVESCQFQVDRPDWQHGLETALSWTQICLLKYFSFNTFWETQEGGLLVWGSWSTVSVTGY